MNPEGKVFSDSVRHEKHICKIDFVKSWLCTWPGMVPNMIESDTIFRIFERGGFKIIEIEIPRTQ